MTADPTSITPSPRQLRALTHPMRLRMLGILRVEGPQTATALAQRLGLNTGATSYHLRQLAQHGFIVDDSERGTGRERWWQAAHTATRTEWETTRPDPDDKEALDAYLQTVVVVYAQQLQAAVEEFSTLPPAWRNASTYSDWRLRLDPAQTQRLIDVVSDLLDEFQTEADAASAGTDDQPDGPSVGVEQVTVMFSAFPRPGLLGRHQG